MRGRGKSQVITWGLILMGMLAAPTSLGKAAGNCAALGPPHCEWGPGRGGGGAPHRAASKKWLIFWSARTLL